MTSMILFQQAFGVYIAGRLPHVVGRGVTLPFDQVLELALTPVISMIDDGLDLTYQWSSALPPETSYRCPLPHWSERETHLVVRSGTGDLGRWLREERHVYTDRSKAIGGPSPRRITRVWLIAVIWVKEQPLRRSLDDISVVEADAGAPG